MTVLYRSTQDWGSSLTGIKTVAPGRRTEFFVHYDGGEEVTRTGDAIPRAIERTHRANGWKGIGYNFVVDQAGNVYEGRGWNGVGAHCPNHNISGIGVQVAIGADQTPSAAALNAVRDLYDEACNRAGRQLAKLGHRDGKPTACPGGKLYAWVKLGMPRQTETTPGGPVAPSPPVYGPTPAPAPTIPMNDMGNSHRLSEDGDFGARTISRLQESLIRTGSRLSIDGRFGPASKKALQSRLNHTNGPVRIDGDFGPKSVRALQANVGTTQDGDWGPKTTRALQAVLNRREL